jgi:DNA-binding transcriptional MerR regulator
MKHRVERERGRKFIGLPEFAAVCNRVVSDMDLEQQRGTVTSVPDERTIRYYLSEGLVQAPEERQGTASVFSYLNLLQIVAVKKLQAEHLPIRKIRDLVSGKSEQELEALLGLGEEAGKRGNEAKQYLESLLTGVPTPRDAVRQTRVAKLSSAPSPPQVDSSAAAPGSWHRVEIEPGLELHIRSDYSPPASSARTRTLAERIRSVLNKWRS